MRCPPEAYPEVMSEQDVPAAPKKKVPPWRVVRRIAAVLGALVLVAAVIVFAPFGYLVAIGSG